MWLQCSRRNVYFYGVCFVQWSGLNSYSIKSFSVYQFRLVDVTHELGRSLFIYAMRNGNSFSRNLVGEFRVSLVPLRSLSLSLCLSPSISLSLSLISLPKSPPIFLISLEFESRDPISAHSSRRVSSDMKIDLWYANGKSLNHVCSRANIQ